MLHIYTALLYVIYETKHLGIKILGIAPQNCSRTRQFVLVRRS